MCSPEVHSLQDAAPGPAGGVNDSGMGCTVMAGPGVEHSVVCRRPPI